MDPTWTRNITTTSSNAIRRWGLCDLLFLTTHRALYFQMWHIKCTANSTKRNTYARGRSIKFLSHIHVSLQGCEKPSNIHRFTGCAKCQPIFEPLHMILSCVAECTSISVIPHKPGDQFQIVDTSSSFRVSLQAMARCTANRQAFNTFKVNHNGRHFAYDIFKYIFANGTYLV